MGNREDLLAGARRVILERGVAKATARDIAAEAGVSLAAIGYHFGSKDRLVTEALVEALGSGIGDDIEALVLESRDRPVLDGFAEMWNRTPQVFADHREALIASIENTLRVLRDPDPEAARQLREGVTAGHLGMAENLRAAHPDLSEAQIDAIARLSFVLVQGLGLLWLIDPDGEHAYGDRFAAAVAALAGVPQPPH